MNRAEPPTVEVRVPTYRRPAWLVHALRSLQAQTLPTWQAIVLDDSPDHEACAVVGALGDSRIRYHANPARLGAAGNIDQAFSPTPFTAAPLACILEDDNWFEPTCLEENATTLQRTGATLLLRNQVIGRPTDHGPLALAPVETTRGTWFTEGWYTPAELHARLFFMEGVSNGGLFWRQDGPHRLAVGPSVRHSGLQEWCRNLGVNSRFWFAAAPLAGWSRVPEAAVTRERLHDRAFARGVQSLRRSVVRRHGETVLGIARQLALTAGSPAALANALADVCPTPWHRPPEVSLRLAFLSWLRSGIVADPLQAYFTSHPG